MNEQDWADFKADGLSRERRAQFEASDRAVRAWQREHPMSLDEYLDFLAQMQELFGAAPRRDREAGGSNYRL